jgi:hypothetical protein
LVGNTAQALTKKTGKELKRKPFEFENKKQQPTL